MIGSEGCEVNASHITKGKVFHVNVIESAIFKLRNWWLKPCPKNSHYLMAMSAEHGSKLAALAFTGNGEVSSEWTNKPKKPCGKKYLTLYALFFKSQKCVTPFGHILHVEIFY